ncbi:MAG: hypothetical protein IJS68_00610 [Clostridia bacterium]|nr:hypothetical protein [Clostridia bacterium]
MKEFLGCCFASMLAGVAVGAIVVSQNKQIAELVKKGTQMAQEKIEDISDSINKAKKK